MFNVMFPYVNVGTTILPPKQAALNESGTMQETSSPFLSKKLWSLIFIKTYKSPQALFFPKSPFPFKRNFDPVSIPFGMYTFK
jgi:CMP-2-keto-3-deoxyoctulosonic acid synthetase